MSFDPTTEAPITLTQACRSRIFPPRRDGKRMHLSTLIRWSQRGCRGVKLETLRIGGALCTSEAAILRFIDRLSNPGAGAATPSPRKLAEEHARAESKLAAAGI